MQIVVIIALVLVIVEQLEIMFLWKILKDLVWVIYGEDDDKIDAIEFDSEDQAKEFYEMLDSMVELVKKNKNKEKDKDE